MSEAVYTSGSALYIKARGRDQSAAASQNIKHEKYNTVNKLTQQMHHHIPRAYPTLKGGRVGKFKILKTIGRTELSAMVATDILE